jgi:uncharacterized membrane protein YkvA (DUF1232 family)
MKMLDRFKARARGLRREVFVLALAYRDPRTPWYARAFTLLVVAYALSPIDLIPDFIPILGYLDDLLLVPLGVLFAVRMIPPEVLAEARLKADRLKEIPSWLRYLGLALMIVIWLVVLLLIARAIWRF